MNIDEEKLKVVLKKIVAQVDATAHASMMADTLETMGYRMADVSCVLPEIEKDIDEL